MSNHFKSIGLFCWAAWCEFSRLLRPVLQFFSGIFNFFLLFSECFSFPRSQFPIGCGVFSFFAVAGKMGTARTFIPFPIMRMCGGFSNRTSSMRRLQILIHVRRCHTIRITRKASLPCVTAGKNGAVDHFCERHIPRCNKM